MSGRLLGLALLALSAVLLGLIWPGIVQQFQVNPSQADREEPYIKANIDATRAAYDLEDIEVEPYTASSGVGGTPALDTCSAHTSRAAAARPWMPYRRSTAATWCRSTSWSASSTANVARAPYR